MVMCCLVGDPPAQPSDVANPEHRAFNADEIFLLQGGEDAGDGLARSADHLRDFFMREGERYARFVRSGLHFGSRPAQQHARQLLRR